MNTLILASISICLKSLAAVAPRSAGRAAYRLFSTPRSRRAVPKWAEDVMAEAQNLDLSVNGLRIVGYRWPGRKGAPRVMLVHGWESRAARLAAWVRPLLDAGYEVVGFDAAAHGESEGRRADPLAFVQAMEALAHKVGPANVCIGHSLGGLAALIATSRDAPGALDPERLVILAGAESGADAMGMFCDVLGLGRGFLPLLLEGAGEAAGRPIHDFDGHRVFAGKRIPTLWIHDEHDDEVLIQAAERVARSCEHVTLERAHGLGHHKIVRDLDVVRRGVRFLCQGDVSGTEKVSIN